MQLLKSLPVGLISRLLVSNQEDDSCTWYGLRDALSEYYRFDEFRAELLDLKPSFWPWLEALIQDIATDTYTFRFICDKTADVPRTHPSLWIKVSAQDPGHVPEKLCGRHRGERDWACSE